MDGSDDFSGIVVGPTPGQVIDSRWDTWDTNINIKVLAGDFNGDGLTDVMKFDEPAQGTSQLGLWVGRSQVTWSLRNRYVALEANKTYDITFNAMHVAGPLDIDHFLKVQNLSGVMESGLTWRFTQAGERVTQTLRVSVGGEPGNTITFGSSGAASYMVDNIRIEQVRRPTRLGPLPYRSQADSPFDLSGLGTDFFLEDFEDGLLNTPGVSASAGAPLGPGGDSDSVDANGRSFFSLDGSAGITFTFDTGALGSLPTQAGIVWTDGFGETTFEAFDPQGTSLGVIGPFAIADDSFSGTTGEDHFFGMTYREGISAIKISNSSGGIEVDHLQYGQSATPTVCYDFDLPVGVGAEDVRAMAGRWRRRSIDPDWDSRFDPNGDETIDVADIIMKPKPG